MTILGGHTSSSVAGLEFAFTLYMMPTEKNNRKSQLFVVLTFILLPVLYQNCGDVDVSRSLSLSSEGSDDEELEIFEEDPVLEVFAVEEPDPKPEIPMLLVVPKVTRFEFTAAQARLSDGSTLNGDVVLIPNVGLEIVNRGLAEFTFTVEVAGEYVVDADTFAPNTSSNSYFANMDTEPTAEMVWHILPTTDFAIRRLTRGGLPDVENPEHRFILDEGLHVLKLRGREPNIQLRAIAISKVP